MAASEGVSLEWGIVEYSRIAMNKQKKVTKVYSQKIKKQIEECVGHIFNKFGNSFDIYHSDENVPGIGAIYAKPEPKTDIVIIQKNKKYFVSVKMAGGVQLASGQGESTAELFNSVANILQDTNSKKVLFSIIKSLKVMPTRLLSQSNVSRIKEEASPKVIEEFIKNGKVITDKSYEMWMKNNKTILMESLFQFIQENDNFYTALLKEAMTGEKTLKQYRGAVADSIISPTGFYMITDAYVEKIKPKVKMDIRAKSRGGISSVAFRIETKGGI